MHSSSPWQPDPSLPEKSRGSLGQFMERSTSAPPLQVEPNSLVGNDLLDYVTKGYGEMSVSVQSSRHLSKGEDDVAPSLQQAALGTNNFGAVLLGASPPEPDRGSFKDNALHGSVIGRSSSRGPPGAALDLFEGGLGLVRSQSAAPSLHSSRLGPPPGLGNGSKQDPFGTSPFRPPSAHGAVRPAAKTLMDLIQEDAPEGTRMPSVTGVTSPSPYDFNSRRSRSPGDPSLQQQQAEPPYNSSVQASSPHSQKVQVVQHQQAAFGTVNAPGVRQSSPDGVAQQQMFAQQQQQQPSVQQVHIPQQQSQQPIYYGGQHAQSSLQAQTLRAQGMHGLQNQGLQGIQTTQVPHNLQAQVLPNGQTVYVNAAPQQQAFSYATIPYHQQVVHQPIANQDNQFVSVMSLQGSGQQVTFWQPPNGNSGMLQSGAPGIQQQQQHRHSLESPHNHRRNEKHGGGRGRRGTARRDKIASNVDPLLEEFRQTKTRDWTMRRIEGHIVAFCQDQNGSRFIQQRLEIGDVTEQQIVMQEVLPAIRRLRNDVFGNYVVQKLLDFGTSQMKLEIRETLEGEMLPLSLQMYGCRVVQKALETLDEDEIPRLLREFHHNVLSCIHDQNGNHVIQKCIEVLNSRANKAAQIGDTHRAVFLREQIDFVVDDVLANTASLSCHPYGCRVLQRILEHCEEQKKIVILDEIQKYHKTLLDDQYGNYVIQHVLQYGREGDRDSILHLVNDSGLLGLSRQKFASNVVEKLLKYGNGNQRKAIVREMLKTTSDPVLRLDQSGSGQASVVLLMVRDAYANYVVQTTLDVVPESEEKRLLLQELNSHSEELRNYTFAKHIVAKLNSLSNGR